MTQNPEQAEQTGPTGPADVSQQQTTEDGAGAGDRTGPVPEPDQGQAAGRLDQPDRSEALGTVVPFPQQRTDQTSQADQVGQVQRSGDPTSMEAPSGQTSYEVELDEEPDQITPAVPVDSGAGLSVVAVPEDRAPIVPEAWRRGNRGASVRRTVDRWIYVAKYHTVRVPGYVLKAAGYSVLGVGRLVTRQTRWWWLSEQHHLRQQAAASDDSQAWMRLHHEARAVRRWRGIVLAGQLLGVAAGLGLVSWAAPWWLQLVMVLGVGAWLAHLGRPVDKPIISAAVVTSRHRKITADVVLRAYYVAGLGHPDKPGQQVQFGSRMEQDGAGGWVLVDLPYGKGFDDAMKAHAALASGLDVALSQVFLTRDPSSHRRHKLWVAHQDPLAMPAGRTPLLACKPTDIWKPATIGLNERGHKVNLLLLWSAFLVGAQPRQGKTFFARLLALYAALDPYVKLSVFDPAGKPDWRKFALVADACGFGMVRTRDGDPIEILLHTLRAAKADVLDRYDRLSQMPTEICPEGKLTRAIARDPAYRMPVHLLVLDEFQEYFSLEDPAATKEIAELLVFLVKVAPAAGVIPISATQKPSGIAAQGAVGQAFMNYRDNHTVRFALKTGSWQVSNAVLGDGAYSEGLDSSALLPSYKGVGILRGADDDTPTVRTYLADNQDAEKILIAARKLREQRGTLTGHAAGEHTTREQRNVLADALAVFGPNERGLHWTEIATRLAERIPEHYDQLTADAISAQLRGLGVPSKDVKHGGVNLKGARREGITAVLDHQQEAG